MDFTSKKKEGRIEFIPPSPKEGEVAASTYMPMPIESGIGPRVTVHWWNHSPYEKKYGLGTALSLTLSKDRAWQDRAVRLALNQLSDKDQTWLTFSRQTDKDKDGSLMIWMAETHLLSAFDQVPDIFDQVPDIFQARWDLKLIPQQITNAAIDQAQALVDLNKATQDKTIPDQYKPGLPVANQPKDNIQSSEENEKFIASNVRDTACEKSPNHVHIKIVGRKQICFSDVSESETIGTLTEKIADDLGVDKRNWGFYVAGPKKQREFLPNSARVREIKLNHDKSLHFLPRTVIR